MKSFSQDIEERLNEISRDEPISYLGLGRHNLQIALGEIRFSCEAKVRFVIENEEYEWTGEPIAAPVWALVGQKPDKFELMDELSLRISLSSGDRIEIVSDHSDYEAVVIEWKTGRENAEVDVF